MTASNEISHDYQQILSEGSSLADSGSYSGCDWLDLGVFPKQMSHLQSPWQRLNQLVEESC